MIKKTVSDKVLAANRRNAQRCTGPKNVGAVKENARKHRFLAKGINFRSEQEEGESNELLDQIHNDSAHAV